MPLTGTHLLCSLSLCLLWQDHSRKRPRAIALRTIDTIAVLGLTDIASEESVFAAMGKSVLSFWKTRYGVRFAIFLETPKSWSGNLRKAAKLLPPYKTRRRSKSVV